MNKEDKLILGTLAGVDLVLSPEHYEEYRGTLNKQLEEKDKEIDRLNNLNKQLVEECQKLDDEETRLNNIIEEIENTIENFMENHTEGYIDWKYDREIYLAESNVLQKLYDTYFDKLQELKENKNEYS